MNKNKKIRVWVCMPNDQKNLQFHTTPSQFKGTFNFINSKYSQWEQMKVYDKETNEVLNEYYNYEHKKEFPSFHIF